VKEIKINKAQPPHREYPIESIAIIIDEEVKDCESLERWRHDTNTQGIMLANALSGHLPGAILDAMIVELLKRKQSLFAVPMFDDHTKSENSI
jgi:hypothetical protein